MSKRLFSLHSSEEFPVCLNCPLKGQVSTVFTQRSSPGTSGLSLPAWTPPGFQAVLSAWVNSLLRPEGSSGLPVEQHRHLPEVGQSELTENYLLCTEWVEDGGGHAGLGHSLPRNSQCSHCLPRALGKAAKGFKKVHLGKSLLNILNAH